MNQKRIFTLLAVLVILAGMFGKPHSASAAVFSGNNHCYEFVAAGGINQTNSIAAIQTREATDPRCYVKGGGNGYLATISDASENAFVTSLISGQGFASDEGAWLAGSDRYHEGAWYWRGKDPTSWASGEAWSGYTNWKSGAPDNDGPGTEWENCLLLESGGTWNDFGDGDGNDSANGARVIKGYIVEYEPAPPIAVDDTITIHKNVAYSGSIAGNDIYAADASFANLGTPAYNGAFNFGTNGAFSYTTTAAATGNPTTSFTYHITDPLFSSNTATVTLNIVNDAPIATANYAHKVNRSLAATRMTPITVTGAAASASDANGDPMTAVLNTRPAHSTGTNFVFNSDGSYTYTADDPLWSGVDTFTYHVVDNELASSNIVTVSITIVNQGPSAVGDVYETNEDTVLTVNGILKGRALVAPKGLLFNDSADPEADTPIVALVGTAPTHGSVAIAATGSFVYTPALNFYGTDTFTYTACDSLVVNQACSTPATVTVYVVPVPDKPLAIADGYSVPEDTTLYVSGLSTVLKMGNTANSGQDDYDPDSPSSCSGCSWLGTEPVTAPIPVTPVEETQLVTTWGVPAHGVLTNTTALGEFTYTPSANYCGYDSFTYQISSYVGAVLNAPNPSLNGTATIYVECVNDQPTLIKSLPDLLTLKEDDADIKIDTWAYFTDIEDAHTMNYSFTLSNQTVQPSSLYTNLIASISMDATGRYAYIKLTPNASGSADVTLRATDKGSLPDDPNVLFVEDTFHIIVVPVPDKPVAKADTYAAAEDTLFTVNTASGVMSNDYDVDVDTIDPTSALLVAKPLHGTLRLNTDGSFTYLANLNYCGADSFTYTIADNNADTLYIRSLPGTVTLNIACVNDQPTLIKTLPDLLTLTEDGPDIKIDTWAYFTDLEDVHNMTYSFSLSNQTVQPATLTNLIASMSMDTTGRYLYLKLTPKANGNADVTLRATDKGALPDDPTPLFVEDTFHIIVAPIEDLILIEPLNNAILHNNTNILFDWKDYTGATGYGILISTQPSFATSSNITNLVLKASSYTRTVPANATLYWKVRALAGGKYSAWSEVRMLTTANPPSAPLLVSPIKNVLVTGYNPLLNWSTAIAKNTVFDHYQIQVDTNPNFSSAMNTTVNGILNHSLTLVSTLNPDSKYYWRVCSWNTAGDYSNWSAVGSFVTAPPAPILVSPIGAEKVTSLRPIFDWTDVSGTTQYQIQFSRMSNFSSVSSYTSLTSDLTLPVGKSFAGKLTVYWRVRTIGVNAASAWSNIETFVTP